MRVQDQGGNHVENRLFFHRVTNMELRDSILSSSGEVEVSRGCPWMKVSEK
jgi:hypothetical protein